MKRYVPGGGGPNLNKTKYKELGGGGSHTEMYKLTWLKVTTPVQRFGGRFQDGQVLHIYLRAESSSRKKKIHREVSRWQRAAPRRVETIIIIEMWPPSREGKKTHNTPYILAQMKNHTNPEHNQTKQATFRPTHKKSTVSFPWLWSRLPPSHPLTGHFSLPMSPPAQLIQG